MELVPDGSVVPRRLDRVIQAEVDGDLVLLSPKDYSYFGATGVGADVWDRIDGTRSLDEIIRDLELEFEAEDGAIRADTLEFVDALVAAGLVELA